MRVREVRGKKAIVRVGYAARGARGLLYARSAASGVLRLPFVMEGDPYDRVEVGYCALRALLAVLRKKGYTRLRIGVSDDALVRELRDHEDVPADRLIAHLRLRCLMNAFADVVVEVAGDTDLEARARAEIALHDAA